MKTQLNSTKKNYALAVTSFIVMFLFLFSASPSSTLAQCPTDIPPTSVGWTSYTRNFGITGTSCIASVQFCKRQLTTGEWQTYLGSITPLTGYWGTGCDDLTWFDVISDLAGSASER